MPPPCAVITTHSSQPNRHSIVSDDSSAASSADYFGTNAATSRPISATTLASSRPSSVASNASSASHVQGQLTSCADLLSPGLASALGLLPPQTGTIAFPSSTRNTAGQPSPDPNLNSVAASRPAHRRIRAQSAHTGALANRRPSLPTAPITSHRISVASVSSFESLPEDEIVQGFLAPGAIQPKSRALSYDRITRSAAISPLNTKDDHLRSRTPERSGSATSLDSASIANSSDESSAPDHPSLSDTALRLSSSTASSAHGAAASTVSSSSTITASSSRPSYFFRRAATSPVPAADLSLLFAHRKRSALELLDTERSFVASLTLIHEEYYQPLLASLGKGKAPASASVNAQAPILSRKSINDIFSNFYDIMQLSKELLSQLEERLHPLAPQDSVSVSDSSQIRTNSTTEIQWDASVDCIGDILATLAPFLKMYSLYVKNFSSALQRIDYEQKNNDAFAKFLKETDQKRAAKEKVTSASGSVRQAFGYGLGFQAHLLTIVQRIPRYKLLVEELLKATPETHPDHIDLVRASHMIEQVASYINENVRQHEMVLTMLGLQKSLQGLTEPLVVPGRALIKRGTLMKTCRRNIQPREFFLFTDCLIYASPISGSIESASAAWTALAQRGGLYGASAVEQIHSPIMSTPPLGAASPIESVLTPPSVAAAPLGPRARLASVPEPYTPLAGVIFSLAGHQLQFRDKFGLRDCTVVSVDGSSSEGLRHCFEIRTPDKSFAVYAENHASREAWVNCIRDARSDLMSARRTLKADEDSIEAKRERRRSLYQVDASKPANRRLSTQSLGAYLAATHLIGQDKTPAPAADQSVGASASRSVSRERDAPQRRSRVDSLPNLLMRPPSFPSFAANGTNLSLANLLASSNPSSASSPPLRVLEDYNAPVWVPDSRADKCCNCQEAFGMWRRKHHCRLCGQVVCWTCSQRSFLIPSYQDGEPDRQARACDGCYDSVFPPDAAEEAEAAAAAEASAAPDSADMSSVPTTGTDGSVAQAFGAYRIGASDADTDAEGSRQGSPLTPPSMHTSAMSLVEQSSVKPSITADVMVGRSAMANKDNNTARPKSLRFEALPPPELEIDSSDRGSSSDISRAPVSPTTLSAPLALPVSQPALAPVERRGSASARTSPSRPSQPPVLPARSKSLAGPLASGSPRVIWPEARLNRASALEAHHLFNNHHRSSQIQAATSGSGTFRLVTPRLTTPEAEIPPGMSKRTGLSTSILDAAYFGGAAGAIQEDAAEDENATQAAVASTGTSPLKTSEPFKPWMLHAMSPAGGAPQLRPARKRPLSAAARLSSFYGPLLSNSSSTNARQQGEDARANASSASAIGESTSK